MDVVPICCQLLLPVIACLSCPVPETGIHAFIFMPVRGHVFFAFHYSVLELVVRCILDIERIRESEKIRFYEDNVNGNPVTVDNKTDMRLFNLC